MRRIIFAAIAILVGIVILLILWSFIASLFSGTTTKKETQRQSVPFRVETRNDSNLAAGDRVVDQRGQTGTKEVTYKVTFKKGKEVSRTVDSEKVITSPKDEIDRVGTAQSTTAHGTPNRAGDENTPVAGRDSVWQVAILLSLIVGQRWYARSARELVAAARKRG